MKWPRGRALKIATGGGFAGIAKLIADDIEQNLGITVEIMVGDDSGALSGARALAEGKLVPAWDLLLNFWFDISSEATPAMIHPSSSVPTARSASARNCRNSTTCTGTWRPRPTAPRS